MVKPKPKENETKEERFIRLAESRTDKALEAIRILSNCSNPSKYDYSDKQVNNILVSLILELLELKQKFYLVLNRTEKYDVKGYSRKGKGKVPNHQRTKKGKTDEYSPSKDTSELLTKLLNEVEMEE